MKSKKNFKKIITAVIGLFIVTFFFIQRGFIYNYIAENNKPVDYSHILVKKVIDGDTFILSTGESVRFIGIDTPELYKSDKLYHDAMRSGVSPKKITQMGKLSYLFTKNFCEGKYVRLEFGNKRFDKYGRILAYIFLDDGTMLNELILKEGHGLAYLMFYFRQDYKDRFIIAEHEAKRLKKGLWNMKPGLKELERLRR